MVSSLSFGAPRCSPIGVYYSVELVLLLAFGSVRGFQDRAVHDRDRCQPTSFTKLTFRTSAVNAVIKLRAAHSIAYRSFGLGSCRDWNGVNPSIQE